MSESNTQTNKALGAALLGLGLLFLVTQIFNISLIGLLWPLFVMLPGVPFLYAAWNGGEDQSGLIFPGLIISGIGAILLYQNITGHWESWAYAWALIPAFVGLGLRFQGERTGSDEEANTGRHMVRYSLMAFAGFALFFEVLIFGSIFSGLMGILLPLALLGGGIHLIMKNNHDAVDEFDAPVKVKNDLSKHKRKHDNDDSRPFEEGPSPEIDPELRRKINEALADDDSDIRTV